MATRQNMLLAALVMVCTLPAPRLSAQEPARADSEVEVEQARVRLAEEIDKSVESGWYVDLASTLVASNPLGIDVAAPDAALKAQLGLAHGQGVVVTAVPKGSQGEKAGVKAHDVLLAIDGQGVGDAAELKKLLDVAEGKEVNLMLRRGGKTVELKTTLTKPATARLAIDEFVLEKLANVEHYRIGVTLSEADDTLRAHLGLAAGEGLVVTEVFDDTAAADAGIRVHDVLTVLSGKRLTTVDAINAQIQEIKDKQVELRLLRGGKEQTIQIAPRKSSIAATADKPVRFWQADNCRTCHASVHQLPDTHALMGLNLGTDLSVWTDGHHAKVFSYGNQAVQGLPTLSPSAAANAQPSAPQKQIESLQAQLAEMQKTLSALQASLQQPAKSDKGEDDK